MVGGEGLNTTKLPGWVHKKDIVILVDSSNTYNFVDVVLVHQLKLAIETMVPLQVAVVIGEELSCDQICKEFQWEN